MKKRRSIIIGIILSIFVAGVSYVWATNLMDSIYAYQSPLHYSPPPPGEPVGQKITRSVVVVLIDGLRYDTSTSSDVMPYLNELRSEGAHALMHSRPPSYSQSGYATLLTSAWPELHDAPLINVDYNDIPTFTQDDIFSAAQRAGLSTAISSHIWFEKLIPQNSLDDCYYTSLEDRIADRRVTDSALPWLGDGRFQLVLLHLDQVDYAGHHEGGPVDPRWNEAATRSDQLLEEIALAMDLTQDTLVIVSDHGHLDHGNHGGQDSVTLLEPFIMVGKGIVPGKYGDVQMVDVAPTIAALLGTNIPASSQGKPLVEMLELSLDQLDEIYRGRAKQQEQLAIAYAKAINQPVSLVTEAGSTTVKTAAIEAAREARLFNERIPRGIISILAIVLVLNLAVWNTRPHMRWMLGGVVTYLVLFNVKYAIIDHKTYSLSSVTSASSLITAIAMNTAFALVISWLIVIVGTRAYQLRSQPAANLSFKFIFATLAFLAIPVVVHYMINGATVTWAIPDFLLSFLGLVFLIQAMVVAITGTILTGVIALVGLVGRKQLAYQES